MTGDRPAASLAARLVTYQAERFPLRRNAPVLFAYGAAMAAISAHLAGRPWPSAGAVFSAFVVVLLVFFQLRVCDEVKDREHDARWQPERPIPRGLISLREVVLTGVATIPVALAAALLLDARLLWPLLAIWVWVGLMTVEFFVPAWLRARPVAYMVSHMVVVPLITLYATACEWLPREAGPPPGIGLLLALSYANGCVNEIGRKMRAPESERPGVETYTALWGMRSAAFAWLGCILAALLPMVALGFLAGAGLAIGAVGLIGAAAALGLVLRFLAGPTAALGKAFDVVSGLWVLVSYAALGILPGLLR
jgi:4-hydroxybenzoate polyprenyltransferase